MKKMFLFPALALVGLLFFQGTAPSVSEPGIAYVEVLPDLPPDVKVVVDQKCYGCHNADSKNDKGKAKLDWDQFKASKRGKQMAMMKKINEVVVNGDMPPKKYLENRPEGKLSEEDMAILTSWSAGKKSGK